MFYLCHTEFFNDRWWILYPDSSKAWPNGFKSKSWATRVLYELIETERSISFDQFH